MPTIICTQAMMKDGENRQDKINKLLNQVKTHEDYPVEGTGLHSLVYDLVDYGEVFTSSKKRYSIIMTTLNVYGYFLEASTLDPAVDFFQIPKDFLYARVGRPMMLRASSADRSNLELFSVTAGVIYSVEFFTNDPKMQDGFQIQLRNRYGIKYDNLENFFGDFNSFEVQENAFHDTLKIYYKDGSFFHLDVQL